MDSMLPNQPQFMFFFFWGGGWTMKQRVKHLRMTQNAPIRLDWEFQRLLLSMGTVYLAHVPHWWKQWKIYTLKVSRSDFSKAMLVKTWKYSIQLKTTQRLSKCLDGIFAKLAHKMKYLSLNCFNFSLWPVFSGLQKFSQSMASSKPSMRCLVSHILVPNTKGVPAIVLLECRPSRVIILLLAMFLVMIATNISKIN